MFSGITSCPHLASWEKSWKSHGPARLKNPVASNHLRGFLFFLQTHITCVFLCFSYKHIIFKKPTIIISYPYMIIYDHIYIYIYTIGVYIYTYLCLERWEWLCHWPNRWTPWARLIDRWGEDKTPMCDTAHRPVLQYVHQWWSSKASTESTVSIHLHGHTGHIHKLLPLPQHPRLLAGILPSSLHSLIHPPTSPLRTYPQTFPLHSWVQPPTHQHEDPKIDTFHTRRRRFIPHVIWPVHCHI